MPASDQVKFLLVDDLDENLRALEALLRQDGLQIFKARSGTEALELLLAHNFALALLDVQMPEMDGFELAEFMRGMERTRLVPIIFITAAATDEGRRFRGYETGAVDYLFKPIDPQIVTSKAQVFFELGRQRQELSRQRDELRDNAVHLSQALRRLQAHGDNSPLAIVEFDRELRLVSWSKGAERMFGWTTRETVGKRVSELNWLQDEDAARLASMLSETDLQTRPREVETMRGSHRDGYALDCEWYSSVLRDPQGRPASLSAQILDVTERRRAEETQQLLIGELNHRVKNTLASVQAIATQTLRHTRNPDEFSTNFSGRIQSLARAHALLSNTTWLGAPLTELIQDQLRLGTIDEARLTISGPEIQLDPQPALRLALIFHELCTNANKYGSLSSPGGRVRLTWSVEGDQLHLQWDESGGPAVKAPTRRGFGTTLIEQSIKADGGVAKVSYRAEGIAWDMTLTLPVVGLSDVHKRIPAPNPASSSVLPKATEKNSPNLDGRIYLVIEDEPLVALDLVTVLEDAGAKVIGPVGKLDDAMRAVEEEIFDGAFLDGNLHGQPVDEVAALLTRRNIPFAFVSGYGRENLPAAFRNALLVGKPFSPAQLLRAAVGLTPPGGDVVRLRS